MKYVMLYELLNGPRIHHMDNAKLERVNHQHQNQVVLDIENIDFYSGFVKREYSAHKTIICFRGPFISHEAMERLEGSRG